MIVKIINRHFTDIIENTTYEDTNFGLIGNDNGFLTYTPYHFSQRTLTARFQINSTNNEIPLWTYFVPKPAITVMGFMSKLYDNKLEYEGFGEYNSSEVGMILTAESGQTTNNFAAVLYNSADDEMDQSKGVSLLLNLSSITETMVEPVGVINVINNEIGNPYKIWKNLGSPR